MTDSPRPRVFVSSVIRDFQEVRQAARQGISAAGGEPVLVNEDFPSLSTSSRTACLDAVASCDIFVVIVGKLGGWTTPSGKLVVEEEYEEARRRQLPVLVFLQNVARDDEATRLARTLSDYVDGHLRVIFSTPDELSEQLVKALQPVIKTMMQPETPRDRIGRYFTGEERRSGGQARVRFVVAPQRDEEVIDPVCLGSQNFLNTLMVLAHQQDVGLFGYEHPKSHVLQGDTLVITQSEGTREWRLGADKVVQVSERGVIFVDSTASGHRAGEARDFTGSMGVFEIAESDVRPILSSFFRFVGWLFQQIDPHKRHQQFTYNAALMNAGMRKLVTEPKRRSGGTVPMHDRGMVLAYEDARLVQRDVFDRSDSEVERIFAMWRRQLP